MATRRLSVRPTGWAVRSAPRGVWPYYLATEAAALILVLLWPGRTPIGIDWVNLGVLLALSVAQTELSRRTEQIRRYFAGVPHVNMTSVWIGAGALLLSPLLAAMLTVAIYTHLWLRVWRPMTSRPTYRVVFSASTMVLACLAVGPVLRAFQVGDTLLVAPRTFASIAAVVVAIAAFTAVNSVLIMCGLKLHNPQRAFLPLYGSFADNALEIATLCLGGVTAALLVAYPPAAVLMLLPVVVLHRCVLMRQLQELATHDTKTGLLNDHEWRNRADCELARAERKRGVFAILIIDLDLFKNVNDEYGHLAGDAVLRSVAEVIRQQVRAYDSVGRFGGEEFVVLLPEMPGDDARAVAERIRFAIAQLTVNVVVDLHASVVSGLSVSIGMATYPDTATALDQILYQADAAMYRAKNNGRNRVVSYSETPA